MILAGFLLISRLLGYQVYHVVSGSMEPAYGVGELLYVKAVEPEEVAMGDIITFRLEDTTATHRVIGIDTENRLFFTKGDANEAPDEEPVAFDDLLGVTVFHIPGLGYVSGFIQDPPGLYITIVLGLGLLAAVFVPDMVKKK